MPLLLWVPYNRGYKMGYSRGTITRVGVRKDLTATLCKTLYYQYSGCQDCVAYDKLPTIVNVTMYE